MLADLSSKKNELFIPMIELVEKLHGVSRAGKRRSLYSVAMTHSVVAGPAALATSGKLMPNECRISKSQGKVNRTQLNDFVGGGWEEAVAKFCRAGNYVDLSIEQQWSPGIAAAFRNPNEAARCRQAAPCDTALRLSGVKVKVVCYWWMRPSIRIFK